MDGSIERLSKRAGRRGLAIGKLALRVYGLWHCVLTATSGCIDTFYSATSVTNLGAGIDATVINNGFSRLEECYYTVLHFVCTTLSFIHSADQMALFFYPSTIHSLTVLKTLKTRIQCCFVSHPVRTYSQMWSYRVQLHSLALS